jgi:hypothetical protein
MPSDLGEWRLTDHHDPKSEGTFSMPSSHSLDAIDVTFDDERLVADAGLIQSATLAQHLGRRELFDTHVDLGDAPGRANVGHPGNMPASSTRCQARRWPEPGRPGLDPARRR